jgi:hypothetical protein
MSAGWAQHGMCELTFNEHRVSAPCTMQDSMLPINFCSTVYNITERQYCYDKLQQGWDDNIYNASVRVPTEWIKLVN